MVQESGTTRLSEGLKWPFGAHHDPARNSHLKNEWATGAGLKEVGIEYQLQLAPPIRLGFLVLRLEEFGVGCCSAIDRIKIFLLCTHTENELPITFLWAFHHACPVQEIDQVRHLSPVHYAQNL